MPLTNTQPVSEKFNQKIQRDAVAAEYFASEAFVKILKEAVQEVIIKRGESHVYITPQFTGMRLQKQDFPYIKQSFDTVKEKYPDLDHIRINSSGDVCMDTQKPSILTGIGRALRQEIPVYAPLHKLW